MNEKNMNILFYILLILSVILTGVSIFITSISKRDINVKLMLYGLSLLIYVFIMDTYISIEMNYEINKIGKNFVDNEFNDLNPQTFFNKPWQTFFNFSNNMFKTNDQFNSFINKFNKDNYYKMLSILIAKIISFTLLLIGIIWWSIEYFVKNK